MSNTVFESAVKQALFLAIDAGAIVTDPSGTVLEVNPLASHLTGYEPAALLGEPLERLLRISQWQDDNPDHPLTVALETGNRVHFSPALMTTKRQPDKRIEGSVTPMHDTDGTLLGAILLIRDLSATRQMAEQVHHYATFDQLTGLVNRQTFEDRLQQALNRARDEQQVHALCYLDLDQFKIVNDTSGHAIGDELLRQLGILLARHIRDRDTLARIGGDEFGLLLENCSPDHAIRIAEGLREDINAFAFETADTTYRVGVSIGLVVIDHRATTVHTLLAAADQACFAAKESGRNRVKVYNETDEQLLVRSNEMHWVSRLHDALLQDDFELFVQPILATEQAAQVPDFSYYELLIRLRDDEQGMLPPIRFLPAAERYGLARAIDRWIIRHYFDWLSRHDDHAQRLQHVSINLSGQSIGDEKMLPFILDAFETYVVDPGKVCFELTETAAIDNFDSALVFIDRMRQLGVSFALDDFGTGMSSFSYLKQLPVDRLKIDGSFVKDVLTDPVDAALVKTIVEIGQTLQLKTIAEYVETLDVLDFVRDVGVDYAQGYGVCRPVRLESLG